MFLNANNRTKPKISLISALIIGFLFKTPSKAQSKNYVESKTYNIESFDKKPQKILVTLDYDDRLKISCLKDTVCIYRSYGIEGNPVVLNKNILEIIYGFKAGSDITERNVIFICVDKNKLYAPLHVTCLSSWDITQVYDKRADSLKLFNEHAIYDLKLKLAGQNKNEYKLIANVHDENVSKHDPSTNYNRNIKTVLNFDSNENVFYNDYKNVNGFFTVYNPRSESKQRQHIVGTFPVVILGRIEYYYINNEWFEKNGDSSDNYLFRYSCKY